MSTILSGTIGLFADIPAWAQYCSAIAARRHGPRASRMASWPERNFPAVHAFIMRVKENLGDASFRVLCSYGMGQGHAHHSAIRYFAGWCGCLIGIISSYATFACFRPDVDGASLRCLRWDSILFKPPKGKTYEQAHAHHHTGMHILCLWFVGCRCLLGWIVGLCWIRFLQKSIPIKGFHRKVQLEILVWKVNLVSSTKLSHYIVYI